MVFVHQHVDYIAFRKRDLFVLRQQNLHKLLMFFPEFSDSTQLKATNDFEFNVSWEWETSAALSYQLFLKAFRINGRLIGKRYYW